MAAQTPAPVRIALFVAGTNEPSNSDVLADAFLRGVCSVSGVVAEKVRMRDLSLAHFTLAHYAEVQEEPDYRRVRDLIEGAAGVAFFSPVWNFSVPAHCKNLLDRMGAFALDRETRSVGQLRGKPFAFVYSGGAPMIAWKALMALTTLHVSEAIKYYGGSVVFRYYEPKCMVRRGQFGLVVDKRPATVRAMERAGSRFGRIASYYAAMGALPPWMRMWQWMFTQLYRIGNRIMYPISARQ
jgi:NAD(P)H-dependent FMN reductase